MPPGAPTAARARRTGTGCAARRAGCTSTTPRRAARSGSRICSARPRPRGLPRPARGSSRSTSGGRSAGRSQRSPLALADASSVRPEDLIATDQVFPDRVGEIYHLAHNPAQRWYYAPLMTPDEVLLIKGWDSLDDGRARFTPHGAFDLPDMPRGRPTPREHRGPHARGDRSLSHGCPPGAPGRAPSFPTGLPTPGIPLRLARRRPRRHPCTLDVTRYATILAP